MHLHLIKGKFQIRLDIKVICIHLLALLYKSLWYKRSLSESVDNLLNRLSKALLKREIQFSSHIDKQWSSINT